MIPLTEPLLNGRELEYVTECIRTNWVSSLGAFVTRFEEEFAAFCSCRHGIAVSNGTVALHLSLVTLGIGPGDEVIVPTLTFVATANAVRYTGATPVFVDSESVYLEHGPCTRWRGGHPANPSDHAGPHLWPSGGHGSDPGDGSPP